jgi:tRNA(adenine34) deaminase
MTTVEDEHFIRESEEVNRLYFEARQIDRLEFVAQAYRDDISIEGGILREDCAQL